MSEARYPQTAPQLAEGWQLQRLTPPSRLYGANGLRTGADGRLYVAQVTGSQISAVDVHSGAVQTISARGGEIIAPDDLAFDSAGNLYATEVMDARVSVRGRDGSTRVLRDDVPFANGITVHQDRLYVSECRVGARLMEIDRDSGATRLLLDNIPMPNAMEMGPDGLLYFPVMGANEIWRISPQGGTPEVVVRELGVPDALKFDAQGRIVSTQVASGQVLRIDPRSGQREVLAQLAPGLDNLSFVDGRLFVSSFSGLITEIGDRGEQRALLPGGLNWPLGLSVTPSGALYIADGSTCYQLLPGGELRMAGMLFTPGYPGFVRGLAAVGEDEFIVTTSGGQIARYQPAAGSSQVLAEGLDQLYGVAVSPRGQILAAELGSGRVLAVGEGGAVTALVSGLREPLDLAFTRDGSCLVSEAAGGRVVRLGSSGVQTVLNGLVRPQGLLVQDETLYVIDAGSKCLLACDLNGRQRRIIARDLPLGSAPGVEPKPLRGLPPFSGPQGPFASIAAGADGTLYLGADGDGSVLALRPADAVRRH
ncbi:Sugar lactone lactonase YvrE [Solimonas aquatica]|uniref:Sugar lactone lactonase YvrE n=1 Tax=Solimonas aquatica TaxID=489703 RepID=A0A1H9KBX9_9GAMM|nr:SMP-30/gluconolactonase/LRE family protein [Solimonas aquatica]SEQ96631.1 Sugar lactone lactonase YvrE [Solimonas aquatica]